MASLKPKVVVAGHGPATDLAEARAVTLDSLVFVRETVGAFMEGVATSRRPAPWINRHSTIWKTLSP
jgi:hypothetical protein